MTERTFQCVCGCGEEVDQEEAFYSDECQENPVIDPRFVSSIVRHEQNAEEWTSESYTEYLTRMDRMGIEGDDI